MTLMAPSRAREGRGGADSRACVGDFFFLLSLVRRGLALGRWQLPLLRRRLLRPRWVASYGVGFESTQLATGWHYGVDLNGDDSRARVLGRRISPLSPCFGVATAAVRVSDRRRPFRLSRVAYCRTIRRWLTSVRSCESER